MPEEDSLCLFFRSLALQFPEEAEGLDAVLTSLGCERITNKQRLGQLTDAHWARLSIPLGLEALIREALVSSSEKQQKPLVGLTSSQNDFFPVEKSLCEEVRPEYSEESFPSLQLEPPEDLELRWTRLLLDTLPPDKRGPLWAQWDAADSSTERFMMFLEYSSYLGKGDNTFGSIGYDDEEEEDTTQGLRKRETSGIKNARLSSRGRAAVEERKAKLAGTWENREALPTLLESYVEDSDRNAEKSEFGPKGAEGILLFLGLMTVLAILRWL